MFGGTAPASRTSTDGEPTHMLPEFPIGSAVPGIVASGTTGRYRLKVTMDAVPCPIGLFQQSKIFLLISIPTCCMECFTPIICMVVLLRSWLSIPYLEQTMKVFFCGCYSHPVLAIITMGHRPQLLLMARCPKWR